MSNDPVVPPAADSAQPVRAVTARAVLLGLALASAVAWLTPVNDWLLRNTPLYNNANPCIVTALALLLALGINPWLGRRRFRGGELVVIISLVLAVGGVVSGGLLRRHTAVMAGPAKELASNPGLSPLAVRTDDGARQFPLDERLYLGVAPDGTIDPEDPEYRATVDRFFSGGHYPHPRIEHRTPVQWRDDTGDHQAIAWHATPLAPTPSDRLDLDQHPDWEGLEAGAVINGATIVSVGAPVFAWREWWIRLAAWSPLILGGLAVMLGAAGVVRKQWIEHERLPYPIAQVTCALIGDPEPGYRFAAIFRNRVFWLGFGITAFFLIWKGVTTMGFVPFGPSMRLELWRAFWGPPWSDTYSWWFTFNLNVWFSVIALTFLVPLDLSFSLWAGYWGLNLLYMLLRQAGIPMDNSYANFASFGGFLAWAGLILWVGRRWYWSALRVAFRRSPRSHTPESGNTTDSDDAQLRDAAAHLRLVLSGCIVMVVFMVWSGAPLWPSLIAVLLFLGLFLVLARIFAEAGLPFFTLPGGFNPFLMACFGMSAPPAALIALGGIGYTLMADTREGLLPYATQAQYLAHRKGVRGWPLTVWMSVALVVALIIGVVTMLWIADAFAGHPDTFWHQSIVESVFNPLADGIANDQAGIVPRTSDLVSAGVGALLVGAVGWARLLWASFPFHPIGLLVCTTYATSVLVFSYFLGWVAKLLVLRYGGVKLYRNLIPCAVGIVSAEAVVSLLFAVVVAVAKWAGVAVGGDPVFMPR